MTAIDALLVPEAPHVVGAAGEPAFTNSWTPFGGGHTAPRFWKHLGVVHIEGLAVRVAGASTLPAFTLPAGYRPSGQQQYPQHTGAGHFLQVNPDGTVALGSGVASNFLVLNVVRFMAA